MWYVITALGIILLVALLIVVYDALCWYHDENERLQDKKK